MKSVEFLQWAATVLLLTSVLVSLIAVIRGTPKGRIVGNLHREISQPLNYGGRRKKRKNAKRLRQ